jgi:hypothetical protein
MKFLHSFVLDEALITMSETCWCTGMIETSALLVLLFLVFLLAALSGTLGHVSVCDGGCGAVQAINIYATLILESSLSAYTGLITP